jgi:hypothetical protein
MQKKNIGKLNKKKQKKGGKLEKKWKKKWKKKWNALWITVVIHIAFGCGETVVSPHPFSYIYNVICNNFWILRELGIFDEFYQIDKFWWEFVRID